MRVLLLDVYPVRNARISKDTNGGYGTVNDYGDGVVARLLTRVKAKSVDWPPMHCAYTAAVLREQGHQVEFLKVRRDQLDDHDYSGFDLCLCTSSIVCHETEVEAVRELRRHFPIGMIGPFASSVPELYLEAGAFVISGEPEIFFSRWKNLADLVEASGVVEPPAAPQVVPIEPAKNAPRSDAGLEELPLPAWDIIYRSHRPHYNLVGRSELFLPIIATRGCPYSCSHYCVYPLQQGKQVRLRSPEAIVSEMSHWQDTLGTSLFLFRDPVFSLNRRHTVLFCEEILAQGRSFKFIIETHLKNMDPELSQLLKRAGLVMVKTGIESASEESMKAAKRFTIEKDQQLEHVRVLEDLGVKVTCFYIFGLPTDDDQRCQRTIDYAKRINSYGAQFSVFTPYPGTPVYQEYKDRVTSTKYEDFTQWNLVFDHDNITSPEMRSILGRAYREYYTNPKWIAKFARHKAQDIWGHRSPRAAL